MPGLLPLLALMLAHPPGDHASACFSDRAALLALDQQAFDQDLQGGWRAVAARPGCELAAADLIRDYRQSKDKRDSILYWHEGQLRALAGQSGEAIVLFDQARHPEPDAMGWNLYVDASISFLKGDKPALLGTREALAALPKPPDFAPRDPSGRPLPIAWPPNLNVVDGFVACFGKSYREAYSPPCTRPLQLTR
jgi:hypothetical protein